MYLFVQMKIYLLYQKISSNVLGYFLFLNEQESELISLKKGLEQPSFDEYMNYNYENCEEDDSSDSYDDEVNPFEYENYLSYCQNPEYGNLNFNDWSTMKNRYEDNFLESEQEDVSEKIDYKLQHLQFLEKLFLEDSKKYNFVSPDRLESKRRIRSIGQKTKGLSQEINNLAKQISDFLVSIKQNGTLLEKKERLDWIKKINLKQKLERNVKLLELQKDVISFALELFEGKISNATQVSLDNDGLVSSLSNNAHKLLLNWLGTIQSETEDIPF